MDRMDKINQMMKREISSILRREMDDSSLEFVTVTKVNVTRDLKHAKVSISVLGSGDNINEILDKLKKVKGYIRKKIAGEVTLRTTPELDFVHDKSISYSTDVEQALRDIKNEEN